VGEFIEHTGDGASFIIKTGDIPPYEHLLRLLYIAELLRDYSEKHGLINVDDNNRTFSLIHIGISKGKGYKIWFGNEKKFVSSATWMAAKACQNAPREYELGNPFNQNVIGILFTKWDPIPIEKIKNTTEFFRTNIDKTVLLRVNEERIVTLEAKETGTYKLPILQVLQGE